MRKSSSRHEGRGLLLSSRQLQLRGLLCCRVATPMFGVCSCGNYAMRRDTAQETMSWDRNEWTGKSLRDATNRASFSEKLLLSVLAARLSRREMFAPVAVL